jgi:hypothetical protein
MKRQTVTAAEARAMLAEELKRSKYGIRQDPAGKAARTVDGVLFDSAGEANRWKELMLLEQSERIRGLSRQVTIEIAPKRDRLRAVKYVADFHYWEYHKTGLVDHEFPWREVYEDFKGADTPVSRIKRNLAARLLIENAVMCVTHADGTREDYTR